jgi:TonB family protein
MRHLRLTLPALVFAGLFVVVSGSFAQLPAPAPEQTTPKIINGGILNGKAVNLPKPQYPEEAKIAKVGGAVPVDVTIDEGGNVIDAKAVSYAQTESKDTMTAEQLERARLRGLLASAAEDAARQAIFSQTLLSGVPIKVRGRILYNFVPSSDEEKTRAIKGGVLNGKAISLPHPSYPPAAKAVNASGAVSIQVLVDENGDVISATAVSGHPLLRAAAESAARAAKFSPTLLNGQPVKISGVLTYVFTLPKKEQQ